MADPPRLRPEDRADFEAMLRLAMSTPDIAEALLADTTGRMVVRMRIRALSAADSITAAAEREYTAYLALRTPASGGTLLPALTALTPAVAAASAAVLLALGHTLRLAGTAGTLPASLVTAGWMLAAIAALSTSVALAALLRTALRGHGQGHGHGTPPTAQQVEQARQRWQQALLDRGLIPYLHRHIHANPSDPARRPSPKDR
ncbi:hypothetical protein [Streptomyces sp. S.PB5]|uniref:hypothetical protein n=1 Tax=Streptomyces sp. S.PB5 TaxID=3020844 RepID=UPI0025B007BA|nr:hypothetical protein [Streptomyces sp. S.PB5]MDN3023965.1 hypothetical protein [Streptomyces sp. S.PB5]